MATDTQKKQMNERGSPSGERASNDQLRRPVDLSRRDPEEERVRRNERSRMLRAKNRSRRIGRG